MIDLRCGDCLEVMRDLPDNSIDAIVTDPPYFRVKKDAWDRQWDKPEKFLEWLGAVADEWQRTLKPNGSLYCFASPKMAAQVEVMLSGRFNVLNRIRWIKEAGWHNKCRPSDLRSYLSPWEEVIFAEHYGADNIAKGEAGYQAKCDELRGFVFEPLRAYLCAERNRAGFMSSSAVDAEWQKHRGTKGCMAGHWFGVSQWALPAEEHYEWLRRLFNRQGGEYLRREYEDLRQEYEDLRQEYEDLRRPFQVTAEVPYTDVWTFKTVQAYPGKHPCEKPLDMMTHIIQASTRPGAVVLDCFIGSGSTGEACAKLGRDFIGIDASPEWVRFAESRLNVDQRDLFAAA
ncbi:MAG: site-specific DNA-methyltransferase [Spiribacter salinus]|uniref:Methyltransferase n=1 Tax=Spiribacter salinus TaxID=1335746 RepID=A0A540VJG6_9GAMM|nr:MAG: site-specific DNA-methyltransferase [Spiribacter salinus]